MMSDFRGGGWGSEMTPKNWTLEGKNRTLGGMGGQKSSDIIYGCSLTPRILQKFWITRNS